VSAGRHGRTCRFEDRARDALPSPPTPMKCRLHAKYCASPCPSSPFEVGTNTRRDQRVAIGHCHLGQSTYTRPLGRVGGQQWRRRIRFLEIFHDGHPLTEGERDGATVGCTYSVGADAPASQRYPTVIHRRSPQPKRRRNSPVSGPAKDGEKWANEHHRPASDRSWPEAVSRMLWQMTVSMRAFLSVAANAASRWETGDYTPIQSPWLCLSCA
jgi:hypothetical protein